jgi:hypothetical protein
MSVKHLRVNLNCMYRFWITRCQGGNYFLHRGSSKFNMYPYENYFVSVGTKRWGDPTGLQYSSIFNQTANVRHFK